MSDQSYEERSEEGHDDDANWKGGIFYFNRKDKRIFPPKRDKHGWTVNFANPLSVLGMIAIVILVCCIINYFM